MNIFSDYRDIVISIIAAMQQDGVLPDELPLKAITAEPPRDVTHGDISTNAAMVLAKPAGKNPREIASLIVPKLEELDDVEKVDIAGPGFINLTLKPSAWQHLVSEIMTEGGEFGKAEFGAGEAINIEYVSANPTGPMHIGHARGAVVGDVLANIMQATGYDVTKEYYINDAGSQVDVLARSAYLRYLEALGDPIEIPEGLYPGEYLIPVGEALAKEHGEKLKGKEEKDWIDDVKARTLAMMLEVIMDDLQAMGVKHDEFTSELKLVKLNAVKDTVAKLKKKGLVYEGVLEPPKGKTPEDWEPREQLLFKTTDHGDDVDRPLQKSDGSYTYFASDLAYHKDKIDRGFMHMVLVLGVDHGGYVKRMQAGVSALSDREATIDMLLCNLVSLTERGEPVKMSKRAGNFVTVRDVLDKVGKDVLRFIMLTRKNDQNLEFDLAKVVEQSKDNPVFYVQYAHARCCSVLRTANEEVPEIVDEGLWELPDDIMAHLKDDAELNLVKMMASYPRVVEAAAKHKEPHRVAFYLIELAGAFHSLWNLGKEQEDLRFVIADNEDLTRARLCLVKSCKIVLSNGLNLLGVEPVSVL